MFAVNAVSKHNPRRVKSTKQATLPGMSLGIESLGRAGRPHAGNIIRKTPSERHRWPSLPDSGCALKRLGKSSSRTLHCNLHYIASPTDRLSVPISWVQHVTSDSYSPLCAQLACSLSQILPHTPTDSLHAKVDIGPATTSAFES